MTERLHADDFFKYAILTGYPPNQSVQNIRPVKIKRRRSRDLLNIRKNEPYIFFGEMKYLYYGIGKKDRESKISKIITDQCSYRYVAYNEYDGLFTKTAKFIELVYMEDKLYSMNDERFMPELNLDNVNVSDIDIEALQQLRQFLDDKRNPRSNLFESTTFCNKIYRAVVG